MLEAMDSAVLSFADTVEKVDAEVYAITAKRAQGRPARGENEVGAQKIVVGMRVALRALKNTNITRKDLARYAGVTPALVTYYFPERNTLIEAATLPVVRELVAEVRASLNRVGSAQQKLSRAVEILLQYYTRDAVIIQLFSEHSALAPDAALPDLLGDLENAIRSFFESLQSTDRERVYDAVFLQMAMIGMCKSVATLKDGALRAGMICSVLLGSAVDAEVAQVPEIAA